jgi:hypothetical protein
VDYDPQAGAAAAAPPPREGYQPEAGTVVSGAEGPGEGEEGAAFDGVAVFAGVHYQYISGLTWLGGSGGGGLLSASYDGSLRLLDVEKVCARFLYPAVGDFLLIT